MRRELTGEDQVHEVFQKVLELPLKGHIGYAQSYARVGLSMRGKALRAQIPYVLGNLQAWTGEEARRCKKVLNEVIK